MPVHAAALDQGISAKRAPIAGDPVPYFGARLLAYGLLWCAPGYSGMRCGAMVIVPWRAPRSSTVPG